MFLISFAYFFWSSYQIIEKMGASFHKRSSELATDTATNREFTYDFLKAHKCDYVIMINPTSPLLRQETMNHFLDYVQEHNFDTVLSVIIGLLDFAKSIGY